MHAPGTEHDDQCNRDRGRSDNCQESYVCGADEAMQPGHKHERNDSADPAQPEAAVESLTCSHVSPGCYLLPTHWVKPSPVR